MAEVYCELDVLEGPEIEIGPDNEGDIDLESSYWDTLTTTHFIIMSGSEEIQQPLMGAGPDQDIYEVDQILDGPRKRREHRYQKCYKIRWKNFGREADSWQPVSDLENVMYMVREFEHKRTEMQKKRRAKKENTDSGRKNNTLVENNNLPEARTLEINNPREGEESEVYGNLKDRFWKKLEMGLYDESVFEGDMYSKVKGSRRAAHADAATSIQKMQQHSQRSPPIRGSKIASRGTGRLKQKTKQKKISTTATSPSSSSPSSSSPSSASSSSSSFSSPSSFSSSSSYSPTKDSSVRPLHLGSPRTKRKRSTDPFSARGYMSAKRSRRSREQRRPSISSMTVGIVSLQQTEPVNEENEREPAPEVTQPSLDVPVQQNGIENRLIHVETDSSIFAEKDVFRAPDTERKMTVTSETLLTVTTESRRLDMDNVIQPEAIVKLQSDENFLPDTRNIVEDLASAAAEGQIHPPLASGAFENGHRSTLDTMSEASGAVERSHSEECLWGGACNRADCKSNRRWNMKNGKSPSEENVSSSCSASAAPGNSRNSSGNASSSVTSRSSATSTSSLSTSHTEPESSRQSHRTGSSSTQILSKRQTLSSHASSSQRERSRVSSSYSPDRSTSSHLNRDSASGAFDKMDALAHRMHMDAIASSSSNKETLLRQSRDSPSRNVAQTSHTEDSSYGSSTSGIGRERPGIFSDSSSFSFMSEDSSANQVISMSSLSEIAPNPSNPSPSGSINLSSPGKENFSSSLVHGRTDRNAGGSAGHERFSMTPESESRREPVSSSSEHNVEMMDYISSTDGWSQRKRGSENSLPLEKIPSPNSRKASDLDQRVLTNTCDELEDMEIQGEDHKDQSLVTNADLLQAVSLNKGEVVRRGIKQSTDMAPKLDFEQPDGNGLTLLMRAVQKSSIAIVEMLIENGANVNARQTNGTTPLMLAVEQREICVVALLLKYGANSSLCTIGTDQGETALIKAIRRQNKDAVSLMLRTGVNFASPDCSSQSALEVAIERRNTQIEALVRSHIDRMVGAFEERVLETLQDTARIIGKLFPVQCFPLRESQAFTITFNGSMQPLSIGEGYLLFVAHTKINDRGVKCRFHGACPIASVSLNGVVQSPLTKEVNFVTSCHPVIPGCNTLVIHKHTDYFSKAKLLVCAYHARLMTNI